MIKNQIIKTFVNQSFGLLLICFLTGFNSSIFAQEISETVNEFSAVLAKKTHLVSIDANTKDFSTDDEVKFQIQKTYSSGMTGLVQRSRNIINKLISSETNSNLEIDILDPKEELIVDETINYEEENNLDVTDKLTLPGKYIVQITDTQNGTTITQDFTWGVLALNTPKSIYKPNESTQIQMAVLDDRGGMVCNAKVVLEITDPSGNIQNLSTENGQIKINEMCRVKEFSLDPDYETEYEFGGSGNYKFSLTATHANGTRSITDIIEVSNLNLPIELKRITNTRIYPVINYPVILEITPQIDFVGTVSDFIPSDYHASYLTSQELKKVFKLDYQLNEGLVDFNFPIDANDRKKMSWQVNYKAGKKYYLAYQYDAPDISPEFDVLGRAVFKNQEGHTEFSEARIWQVAVDDTTGAVLPGTAGSATVNGSLLFWGNDFNILTQNDTSFASRTVPKLENSMYLTATNFGFSLTNCSSIDNVYVTIRKAATTNDTYSEDYSVRLFGADGFVTGNDLKKAGAWASTPTSYSYGTGGTLASTWGATLSCADVEDADFGVGIAAYNNRSGGPATDVVFRVYYITMEIEYTASSGISIGGTCKAYDQSTNCADGQTVKVAVGSSLQGQTTTTSGGTWTISGVTAPTSGDVVTTFLDGVADANEAVSVTKYDGTTNITGVNLYADHLTIGSDDEQTLSNTELGTYDNSVSADEDIFFDVNSETLTVDSTAQSSQEKLYIKALNTFQPDSGAGGDTVNTHDLEIDGTMLMNTNTLNLTGTFENNDSFGAGTSTVTMDGATESITGSSSFSFYNLTIDRSGASGTISVSPSSPTITNTLSVATDDTLSIGNGVTVTHSGATLTLNGTISGLGTYTYSGSGTLPTTGALTPSVVRLDGTSNDMTLPARDFTNTLELYSNSGASARTFTLPTGTLTYSGNLSILAANTQNVTLTGATNSPTVNVTGNIDFTGAGAGSEAITTGTGTWTVSGNVDLTGGSLTATSGNTFNMNGTSKSITSAGSIFQNFGITGGSVTAADSLDVDGTFGLSGGATFVHGAGDNIDLSIANDFSLASGTTWTQNTTSTSQLVFDGDLDFADNNETKQSLGNVVIGTSPDTTNLTTDLSANSLTVSTGDYLNTCEYDLDIGTGGISISGTLDTTAAGNASSVGACAGGNEANETTINNAGNWTQSGTFVADGSTVILDSTGAGNTLTGTMTGGSSFYNLTFNDGGTTGAWSFGANSATILNNFTITGGGVTAPSTTLTIGGNFINSDTFTHNSGTVVFNNASNTSALTYGGTTTFNNLTISTASKAIQFDATNQTTISGTWTVSGSACGTPVTLDSTVNDNQWNVDATGTVAISYADIEDSNAVTAVSASHSTETNNNNTNWTIDGGDCAGGATPIPVRLGGNGRFGAGGRIKQ